MIDPAEPVTLLRLTQRRTAATNVKLSLAQLAARAFALCQR